MARADSHAHVGCHDAAGHGGKAGHHDGHQLRPSHRGQVGPHRQRRFHLADEDVRGRSQAFGARDIQGLLHDHGRPAHHALHDVEVVQDRHQRREEDDDRQHAEGKRGQHPAVRRSRVFARHAEYEQGANVDEAEQAGEDVAELREDELPWHGAQREKREDELQGQAADDHPPRNQAALRAKQPGEPHHHQQPGQADEPFHARGSFRYFDPLGGSLPRFITRGNGPRAALMLSEAPRGPRLMYGTNC